MITAKIDVTKILKEHLFKGAKGTYLDLVIFENNATSKYGDTHTIVQSVSKEQRAKGVKGPIIGNMKMTTTQPASGGATAPAASDESDDVPF